MASSDPKPFHIYNTHGGSLQPFKPITPGEVRFYTCGPTVYNYAHIGNLRTYVSEDIIRRAFEAGGYQVKHVQNVTDVGHLESDADDGDDKMNKAAKREKKTPWEIARYYEDVFYADCDALGLLRPTVSCRATDHIDHMISMVKTLEDKGIAYVSEGNVYYDISKFSDYGKMARLNLDNLEAGARIEVDTNKRNPHDFVLWFSKSKFANQIMQWESPWGRGFPGWHIECSAMATEYLGEEIDIHMGGIDHITVHHTNEIAQAEGASGHSWVNYWMHCNFLVVQADSDEDANKMSKSSGDFLRMQTVIDKGFDPLHYRFFCMGAHYRSELKFSWDNLESARRSFETLKNIVVGWKLETSKLGKKAKAAAEPNKETTAYNDRFWEAMCDDFNMPKALGVVWEIARDNALHKAQRLALLLDFDRILGLGMAEFKRPAISESLRQLVSSREAARDSKDWAKADEIRDQLAEQGLLLMDTADGTDWYQSVD